MQTEHDGALMGWKGYMASRRPYPENRSPRALAMKEFACDAPPWSESKCRWVKSQFVLMMWLSQENEPLEENGRAELLLENVRQILGPGAAHL